VFLLDAVRKLVARDERLAQELDVHFIGQLTDDDRRVAAGLPFVHMDGYRPHTDTVRMMRSADLLFLPMQDIGRGVRARIVPAKTYEYLATRRPILAAVPDGDARDLLAEAGNALLCHPSDSERMADLIREQVLRWRRGEQAPEPQEEVLARYERSRLANELGKLLDTVLETHSPRNAYQPLAQLSAGP
jgi:glycosyltransferase involved in cell wall biosynthesis